MQYSESQVKGATFFFTVKVEQGSWQRCFRKHQIKHELDFTKHVEYIHFNPVKNGLIKSPIEKPYSSFHRYAKQGN